MNVEQQPQHEPLAMDTGRVLLTAAGLVLLLVCGFLVCWGWMAWLERRIPGTATAVPATAAPKTIRQQGSFRPPAMPDQASQLEQLQQQRRQRLSQYGWVDRQRQRVHIPIERAIEIAADRGMSWEWPADDSAVPKPPAPEDPELESDG